MSDDAHQHSDTPGPGQERFEAKPELPPDAATGGIGAIFTALITAITAPTRCFEMVKQRTSLAVWIVVVVMIVVSICTFAAKDVYFDMWVAAAE